VVSWQPHGRCFVVHKPKEFVDLLPKYFKLSKLASFQRQLNLYGFQRLTRGRDRGGYYHELFLRDRVFLSHNIQRIKVKGTGVRARSNPDQEPDFWQMPWVQNNFLSQSSQIQQVPVPQPSFNMSYPPMQQLATHSLSSIPVEEDVICAFENKIFHYLDPIQEAAQAPKPAWTVSGVDDLLSNEAETFFEDFDFPDTIGAEIEDDGFFGDLLESIIY